MKIEQIDKQQSGVCLCQKVVTTQLPYFGTTGEYCGKPAVIKDSHGRCLCQKHYNRWVKKCERGRMKNITKWLNQEK